MLCEWMCSDFKILKLILIFFIGLVVSEICSVLLIFFVSSIFRFMVDFIELVCVFFVLVMLRCKGWLIFFVSSW